MHAYFLVGSRFFYYFRPFWLNWLFSAFNLLFSLSLSLLSLSLVHTSIAPAFKTTWQVWPAGCCQCCPKYSGRCCSSLRCSSVALLGESCTTLLLQGTQTNTNSLSSFSLCVRKYLPIFFLCNLFCLSFLFVYIFICFLVISSWFISFLCVSLYLLNIFFFDESMSYFLILSLFCFSHRNWHKCMCKAIQKDGPTIEHKERMIDRQKNSCKFECIQNIVTLPKCSQKFGHHIAK